MAYVVLTLIVTFVSNVLYIFTIDRNQIPFGENVFIPSPFMMSGPMVDSMILSMADPRSEEVEAVESDTIMPPQSDTAALEWTITCYTIYSIPFSRRFYTKAT